MTIYSQAEASSFSAKLEALPAKENGETCSSPMAAVTGVPADAAKILELIHSKPFCPNTEPKQVRAERKQAGNPFDFADAKTVARWNMVIPTTCGSVRARLYHPSEAPSAEAPALVYYHGGGFVLGSIQTHDNLTAQLAEKSGTVVVSVEYSLAPEFPFPQALNEAQECFNWLYENAEEMGIDRHRIAIGGDSAGANLAAVVCMLNRDQQKVMPALQLLVYPSTIGNNNTPSRREFSEGLLLTKEVLAWYHDHYIDRSEANDPRFNVLEADDHSNLPPAFVLTAGFDPLRDEGAAYADKLAQSNVVVRHTCYTDMFHGFLNFGTLRQAQAALMECAEVLSTSLSPSGLRHQKFTYGEE